MKYLLKSEQLFLFLLSITLFVQITELPWYFYAALFFVPDISFLAYTINTKVGAFFYNLLHHLGLWILVAIINFYTETEWLLGLGIVFAGHSGFDRLFGYGLKFTDSFQHTHLGYIGKSSADEPEE